MERKINPITPDEVTHEIPEIIIDVTNQLIKEKWDGHRAHILQEEILNRIPFSHDEVFDKRWYDEKGVLNINIYDFLLDAHAMD